MDKINLDDYIINMPTMVWDNRSLIKQELMFLIEDVLELAAEKATTIEDGDANMSFQIVDKQSILDVINLIE